jgi:hypothetical protein
MKREKKHKTFAMFRFYDVSGFPPHLLPQIKEQKMDGTCSTRGSGENVGQKNRMEEI